jgi:hypothetical protein
MRFFRDRIGERGRFLRWVAVALVVAVGTASGIVLYRRAVTNRACGEWRRALTEMVRSAEPLVGEETAAMFRREAIARGWVDAGGEQDFRPDGCTP